MKPARFSTWLLPLLLALVLGSGVQAHNLMTSYTSVAVKPDRIEAIFSFDLPDMVRLFRLDADGDRSLTAAELESGRELIHEYIRENVSLRVDSEPVQLVAGTPWFNRDMVDLSDPSTFESLDFSELGSIFVGDLYGQLVTVMVRFPYHLELEEPVAEVELGVEFYRRFGVQHANIATIQWGSELHQTILSHSGAGWRVTAGDRTSVLLQLGVFVVHGIEHIFIGYDHILFLIALIVIGGKFLDLIKVITAFTIAHSVTLILAALEVVSLSDRLIESAIALSIAYVAAENFWVEKGTHRWILTFFFGLIHGFGFANVLGDLGLPSQARISSLLAFNVGVEIGQICIVAACLPVVIWAARTGHQRRFVVVTSSVILLCGLGWFVERAFNLELMPF